MSLIVSGLFSKFESVFLIIFFKKNFHCILDFQICWHKFLCLVLKISAVFCQVISVIPCVLKWGSPCTGHRPLGRWSREQIVFSQVQVKWTDFFETPPPLSSTFAFWWAFKIQAPLVENFFILIGIVVYQCRHLSNSTELKMFKSLHFIDCKSKHKP